MAGEILFEANDLISVIAEQTCRRSHPNKTLSVFVDADYLTVRQALFRVDVIESIFLSKRGKEREKDDSNQQQTVIPHGFCYDTGLKLLARSLIELNI
jgi:hypothetical protein